MFSNTLQKWQQENGFRVGSDTVYGVHRGVGFSVVEEDGGKLFVFMLSGSDNAFDNLEDMLSTQRGDLKLLQVGDVENYVALFFDESAGEMPGLSMSALLDFMADNYRTLGLRAPNICVKCGAPATKRSFLDKMVQPMCADCREKQRQEESSHGAPYPAARPQADRQSDRGYGDAPLRSENSRYDDSYDEYAGMEHSRHPLGDMDRRDMDRRDYDDREREREERARRRPSDDYSEGYDEYYDARAPRRDSVGGGVIGVILGALAGLVPYFISVLLPFELSALCFIAGFGAVLGYAAFDGLKDRKKAVTSIIAATLACSIIAIVFVGFINGFSESFGNTISIIFKRSDLWLSLVFGIVGALLGIAVAYNRILKYVRSK